MQTIRCPECNLVDFENAIVCKRCEYQFQPFEKKSVADDLSQEVFENQHQETPFENNENFAQENYSNTNFQDQRNQFDETFNHFPDNEQNQYSQGQNSRQQYSQNQGYERPTFNQQTGFAQPKPKIKAAITSMVLGILSFPAIWGLWVGILTGFLFALFGLTGLVLGGGIGFVAILLGLILGVVALIKSKKEPNEYGGKGFAITGIVCSTFGLLTIPIIAAIAIPNILAARNAANEGGAISNVTLLSKAQTTFMAESPQRRCATLQELGKLKVIDSVLAKGEKMGYRYLVVKLPTTGGGCEIMATPVSKSTGTRSFFYSTEDSVIRAENKNGEFADKNSPPLDDFENIIPKRPQISENY